MTPRATPWGAYRTIAAALRTRITNGEFAAGATLPSEAKLCTEYGVARNTVRRALEQLAGEGLIVTQPGRERLVTPAEDTAARAVPRYRHIAAELRARIASGDLQPGDALPSEAELSSRYGVARGTARHALAELEGSGLVRTIHGKGRYVRSP
jgi:DNA-binding GntR family transcriptional regulator